MAARRHISGSIARKIAAEDPSTDAAVASSIPLVETKLYVPKGQPGLVPRPALVVRIGDGHARKLTLVSAPAGFGKTTLLAEWLAATVSDGRSVAWVSLDLSDDEPALFWSYVIAALRRAHPSSTRALAWVQPGGQPLAAVVSSVINEIDAVDADFVLVLDDYHVIQNRAIHESMTFLLDRLPARMRVVIASRVEPPLALSRLRARGELTELRVSDLRFTGEEASAFLNEVMELRLSATDQAKLERRTEGWIAALKLAALSIKGRTDASRFVDEFSGDSRYVADYLVDEVLRVQPHQVRRFLLDTAILERMSGPLCDAVTGGQDSYRQLEDLERANLFVVALDDRREWYRYHHLFADVLRTHALREDPEAVSASHRRASAWHEAHGSRTDAVRHAIAGGDLERAARMLETEWPSKNRSNKSARWLSLVRALPEAMVRGRPLLAMGYAWALLNVGELEAAELQLGDVERCLASSPTGEGTDALPFELASARAYLAQARGDTASAVTHSRRALELTPEREHAARATGTALLALAYWADGQLESAHSTFTEALAHMKSAGATLDVVRGIFVLGDIRVIQGRLREARTTYERGMDLAAEHVRPGAAPEADELLLGLAELHTEWGDREEALRLLARVTEGAEQAHHRGNRERWCSTMAAVEVAAGDPNQALALLREAEGVRMRGPLPYHRPIAAMKARIGAKHGGIAEAVSWIEERRLSVRNELSFLHEFEHITLARLLLVRSEGDDVADALGLLVRLAAAAEAGGRTGRLIEILLLEALARQALGDVRDALVPLGRALAMAEPEGFLRLFVDEGESMRDLLRHATARGIQPEATRRVLAALEAAEPVAERDDRGTGTKAGLTPKEIVVLRLIGEGLRNQEIADHLFISPATVKRHIANAYAKLGVGHRTEALVRAKELNLL